MKNFIKPDEPQGSYTYTTYAKYIDMQYICIHIQHMEYMRYSICKITKNCGYRVSPLLVRLKHTIFCY